jgi:putative iron-regulated protein
LRALPAIALWLALVAARPVVADTTAREVLEHYAGLAYAAYSDAHAGAVHLHETVRALIARPTEDTLAGARAGWRAARVPYQQTEAFRFANPLVDEWEGRVNAWPLDEGLIDYVASRPGFALDENPYAAVNVIANQQITLSGRTIDARRIDAELLTDTLHQIDHIEANVAIG